ncbi:hypothetical protein OAB57_03090, partial [Bacteriovoracaceae bacterium]|nr:hypothetical protein [Bacteriovoracaceae bacterium]
MLFRLLQTTTLVLTLHYATHSIAQPSNIDHIDSLIKTLSKTYESNLETGDKKLAIKQIVTINYCQLNLQTFSKHGLIQNDNYNLERSWPFTNVIRFKGLYPLFFGMKSHLTQRSKIYYTNKNHRSADFSLYRTLAKLCHKKDVRSYYQNLRNNEIPMPSDKTFVGLIPQGSKNTGGPVYTDTTLNST